MAPNPLGGRKKAGDRLAAAARENRALPGGAAHGFSTAGVPRGAAVVPPECLDCLVSWIRGVAHDDFPQRCERNPHQGCDFALMLQRLAPEVVFDDVENVHARQNTHFWLFVQMTPTQKRLPTGVPRFGTVAPMKTIRTTDEVRAGASPEAVTLANNLRALMQAALDQGDRQRGTALGLEKLAAQLQPPAIVRKASIARIRAATVSTGIDVVGQIARCYDLQAWQLLAPGLDPTNPPVVTISQTERDLYARLLWVADKVRAVQGGGPVENEQPSEPATGGASRGARIRRARSK